MHSTAFWLVLTVGILNMHHKNPEKYPPPWLENIAVNFLARILCMNRRPMPKKKKKPKEGNGNITGLLSREIYGYGLKDDPATETPKTSWIKVAKIFDRFFLVVFTIVAIIAMVILLCFFPKSSGRTNPRDFPKEQIHWNLTDFYEH